MKTVNVSELKARLSKYLRMAGKGQRIVVLDRNEPVAQLVPLEGEAVSWRERMEREGRLRLGTQDWKHLRITRLKKRVDIQAALQAIREEPDEVRRR
jgi:prevent-host-death family protein